MDLDKVKVVEEWPTLNNLKKVKGFLGFINFYRSMIKSYSEKARLLTELTKKDKGFK